MMDHWERLERVIAGEEVGCLPVSFWQHFPTHDQEASALAAATVAWQRRFDLDFVKFMPSGTYGVEDWGWRPSLRPVPGARVK